MNSSPDSVLADRMRERASFRTRTASTKLTEDEFAELETCARASGKNLSEWCREILLDRARMPAGSSSDPLVIAEVIGLRMILINLFASLAQGEGLTWDKVETIVQRADAAKHQQAIQKLSEAVPELVRRKS